MNTEVVGNCPKCGCDMDWYKDSGRVVCCNCEFTFEDRYRVSTCECGALAEYPTCLNCGEPAPQFHGEGTA